MHRLGVEIPVLDRQSAAAIEALVETDAGSGGSERCDEPNVPRGTQRRRVRVIGELDYREIAARLGCSEGAARTRVHRGLARLSHLLEAGS